MNLYLYKINDNIFDLESLFANHYKKDYICNLNIIYNGKHRAICETTKYPDGLL